MNLSKWNITLYDRFTHPESFFSSGSCRSKHIFESLQVSFRLENLRVGLTFAREAWSLHYDVDGSRSRMKWLTARPVQGSLYRQCPCLRAFEIVYRVLAFPFLFICTYKTKYDCGWPFTSSVICLWASCFRSKKCNCLNCFHMATIISSIHYLSAVHMFITLHEFICAIIFFPTQRQWGGVCMWTV